MEKRKKQSLQEDLDRMIKTLNTIKSVIDDTDDECVEKINQSSELLSEVTTIILKNQKRRGKEFLSDEDIDSLIDKVYKEEGIKKFEEFKSPNKLNESVVEKWKIYSGLGGGFGGAHYVRTFTGTKRQAEKEAYYAAIEEYESYEGLHGLRTVDEIMIDDNVDMEEAQEIYNEERESWLDYYVKPDDGTKE